MKELKSLSQVVEGLKEKFPGLVHWRIPVCNSAAPKEEDFDIICKTLLGTNINTPVIVSDQVGLSRATTGCVIACLFKEFQISASYEGLIETVPGVNMSILKTDRYKMDMTKDALFRGEFEVVKELMAKMKDGAAAKNNADKIIDLNGTKKTGGTGIKQLRENIAESKLSYEIMDDSAQAFLKSKIMDNIHKYFYMIVYAAYMREEAVLAKVFTYFVNKSLFLTLSSGHLHRREKRRKYPQQRKVCNSCRTTQISQGMPVPFSFPFPFSTFNNLYKTFSLFKFTEEV